MRDKNLVTDPVVHHERYQNNADKACLRNRHDIICASYIFLPYLESVGCMQYLLLSQTPVTSCDVISFLAGS